MQKFGYTKEVKTNFLETIENINFSLIEEGFGILCKINMKEKLKEKLDVKIEDYVILGVCNPELGYKSLEFEYEIGLLLPCNIIVYKKNGKVFISTILPTIMMNILENKKIDEIAKIAEKKLKKAIDNI